MTETKRRLLAAAMTTAEKVPFQPDTIIIIAANHDDQIVVVFAPGSDTPAQHVEIAAMMKLALDTYVRQYAEQLMHGMQESPKHMIASGDGVAELMAKLGMKS